MAQQFLPAWFPPSDRFVAAWSAFAFVLLAGVYGLAFSGDPEKTRRRAAANDPGKNVLIALIVAASGMGMLAAFGLLGHDSLRTEHAPGTAALAIGAIFLSWTMIHTFMTLRYAHLYYARGGGSGLQFPATKEPSDLDFAYFSFVIGMTFQTSDVNITGEEIRGLALLHALLSFVFNVAIIAVAVNVATGLLH